MSDPLIRSTDDYVVIEPGKGERFLTAEETVSWLERWLNQMEILPEDLMGQASSRSAAKRLLETACELEVNQGFNLKWFAVRLNPPHLSE